MTICVPGSVRSRRHPFMSAVISVPHAIREGVTCSVEPKENKPSIRLRFHYRTHEGLEGRTIITVPTVFKGLRKNGRCYFEEIHPEMFERVPRLLILADSNSSFILILLF